MIDILFDGNNYYALHNGTVIIHTRVYVYVASLSVKLQQSQLSILGVISFDVTLYRKVTLQIYIYIMLCIIYLYYNVVIVNQYLMRSIRV